ncbi:hypothetical protein HDU97_006310 [Phlyctochytrium planicorne]|nr:hypothetical protein HDU97_006310 [Phlyctochytrium planicorne]
MQPFFISILALPTVLASSISIPVPVVPVNYTAKVFLGDSSGFGPFIEVDLVGSPSPYSLSLHHFLQGAAIDRYHRLFAVNFGNSTDTDTIGVVENGHSRLFHRLKTPGMNKILVNAIRFPPTDRWQMLVADTANKRVLRVNENFEESIACQHDGLRGVPNDMTLSQDGRWLFLSGQKWADDNVMGDGEVWLCDLSGKFPPKRLAKLERTNGIELSPDGKFLYISEAANVKGETVMNRIWKFSFHQRRRVLDDGTIFVDFGMLDGTGGIDVDGMRFGPYGRLFVTRNGGQEVTVLEESGHLKKRIRLTFAGVTNLAFNGSESMYAVGRCGIDTPYGVGAGCIDVFNFE